MGSHTFDADSRLVLDSIRRIVRALRLFDREAEKQLRAQRRAGVRSPEARRRQGDFHQRAGRPDAYASKLRLGGRGEARRPPARSPVFRRPRRPPRRTVAHAARPSPAAKGSARRPGPADRVARRSESEAPKAPGRTPNRVDPKNRHRTSSAGPIFEGPSPRSLRGPSRRHPKP